MTAPVVSRDPLPEGRFSTYRIVVRAVLRGWATHTGYRGNSPVRAAVTVLGIVVILSNIGGLLALGNFRDQLPSDEAVVALSLLIVYIQAAGVVVLLQSIGLGQGLIARGLRLVPLTPAERAIAVNIPLMGIAVASVTTVAVPSLLVVADVPASIHGVTSPVLSPFVWLEALITVVAAAITGACFGFLMWSAAATLGDQVKVLSNRVYPMAIAMLAFGASFHLPALGMYVAPDDGFDVPAGFDFVLFWPAATKALVERAPGQASMAVVSCLVLVAVTGKVAKGMLPILLRPEPLPRRRFAWSADGRFPLLRLELARLLRTRRISAAFGSGIAMAFFGVLAVLISERREAINFDVTPLLGLIVVIPTGQIVLLARGLSARRLPYQLVVGADPARWARAVQGAATLLAVTVAVPLITFLVAYNGVHDGVVRVTAGFLLCVYAGAAVVAAVAMPGRDNAAAEFAGMLIVVVASAIYAATLVNIHDADTLLVPALQVLLAAALSVLPGTIERRRWERDLHVPEASTASMEPAVDEHVPPTTGTAVA